VGVSGTTTVAVCKRAEVSHGSLLHHYGTRERLLGAALDEVYARLQGSVISSLEELPPGEARVEGLIELMWDAFGAREFKAVIELWLAAANKPDVGWAVWPEAQAFDQAIGPLAEHLFPEAAHRVSEFPVYTSLIFQVLQGMGLANATWPDPSNSEAGGAGENMRVQVRALLSRLVRDAFKNPAE
jgi:AcrR family transcriptional regulator